MDSRDAGLSAGELAGSQAFVTKGVVSKPSSAPMESSIEKSASGQHEGSRLPDPLNSGAKSPNPSAVGIRCNAHSATNDVASATPSAKTTTMPVAADVGSCKGGATPSASAPVSPPRAENKNLATTTLAGSVVNTVSHGAEEDPRFVVARETSIASVAARAKPEKVVCEDSGSQTAVAASKVSSFAADSAFTGSEAAIASNSGPRESASTHKGDKARSPTKAVSEATPSIGASFKVADFSRETEGGAPTETGSTNMASSRVTSDDSTDSDLAIPSGGSHEVPLAYEAALVSTSTVTESQAASEASDIALAGSNTAIARLIEDSETAIPSGSITSSQAEVVVATKAALASTLTMAESQAASEASGAALADPNPAIASDISSKKIDASTGAGTKTSAGEKASNAAGAGASAKTGFGTASEPVAAADSKLATSSSGHSITSVGSKEVKADAPTSGSSSGGDRIVKAVTTSAKSSDQSTVVLQNSLTSSLSKDKRHGKQQVQEAASVSAADVVDALSSALSTPRVKQAPVVTARGTQPIAVRGEAISGKGIAEGGRSKWTHADGTGAGVVRTAGIETEDLAVAGVEASGSLFADIKGALIFDQKELAFRKRINRDLIQMLIQNGGSCPMSSVAQVYQRTFKRLFHLGGRKLRNMLENDGGLKRITLDGENGGVIHLEAHLSQSASMGKLTRTIVNKKALKLGNQPSLNDSSKGPTSEVAEPEAAEATNEDNVDLCDSGHLDAASLKPSVKKSTMTYANSGGHTEHGSVRSGREQVYKPPSAKLSRNAGYADRDRDYSSKKEKEVKKETKKKTNRGRSRSRQWSRSRSRSLRSRHLRGNLSTKRNRSREASYSPARGRGDERAANKREGRLRRLPPTRSRSRSEDRGRRRRDKRGQASLASHGRSPESRSLGKNRDRNPESRSFGRNRNRNSESRSFDRNQDGRLRSADSADVSRDEQVGKLRNRDASNRGSSFVVMRVAREEEASGKGRMLEPEYNAHHRGVLARRSSSRSAAAPALGPNHRDHLPEDKSAKLEYDRNPRYSRHEQYVSDVNGGSYHHESSAVNEDRLSHRGGALVEAGARPNKRRLVDGLTESAYPGAQGIMRPENDQAGAVSAESRNMASIDRGPNQYAATTRSGDVGRNLMDKGAGFRGEMTRKPVIPTNEVAVAVGGMRSDIPAPAVLPPPGTIQPRPLSVDRPQGSRLMVRGTHPAVPERRIHALASTFGTVGKIEVLEGFVFVHMKYLEEAERAVVGLSGELLPHVSAGPNIPLTAEVWSEEMYQALMTRENMRTYADSMRKASTWYEKHKSAVFDGRTGASMTCRFFALGRGCVFGRNCVFIHEKPHGLMGNYLGSGAPRVASRPSLDLPAVPPILPPRGHPVVPRARVDAGHFNVRQMIPADGNHEGRPRPMFVQNGEQYSRPSTGPRRGQMPERDFKDGTVDGNIRDAWQSEHRPPNQGVPRRNHALAMRGDAGEMEARTHVDPYGVENTANFPGKKTISRQDHGYGHVDDVRHDLVTGRPKANRGSAVGNESTGHLSQRFDSRSPQRGPHTSYAKASKLDETNRGGVNRRRNDVDATAEISLDSRGRATRGRELLESRSSSRERHRRRGHDTRRHSYDRRDDRVRLHDDAARRDNDISRHNRDVSRHDRDITRQGRFSERRDRSDDRRIRNPDRLRDRDDGRLDRNTFGHSSSRSDSRRAHHRGDMTARRDGVKRERYDSDKDERQAFQGRDRRGRGRGESDLSRDRPDHYGGRNGERGRHHEHPRGINTRQKRARSYDGDSDHGDNDAARQVKRSVEREDRDGRGKRRKDDVASLRRRPDVGNDHHEDEIPRRRPSRDDRAAVDAINNQEEPGQQFLDWDDELMGDGSGEAGSGRPVGTTFTVTARMGNQPTQRDVVPPAGTTFSVTMPPNLTGVLQSRALQGVEHQGMRQGRGQARGGERGDRGRGIGRGRGGRFALN